MKSLRKRLRELYGRLTSSGSTEQQAIQSGIWVAGINVGDRILQLLKVVILARLLSPEAFGLLGIALLVIAALRQFSELGFDQALIQHHDDDVDAYLNTVWVIKIVRGFVVAVIAFFSAPHLAVFFGEPMSEPLIRIIGLMPLVLGVQNPGVVYFQKDLNFHREFVYQVGGRVVDLVVATAIALAFQTVWALAIGLVAMNVTKLTISYLIHSYRPSLEFKLSYAKEMFGFGKWMLASAVLMFIYRQGDDAFIGWFFAASVLGFYQLAYRFSNAPATEITQVISRVAFPALSKVQNDIQRLREGYFRAVQLSTVIAFPMAAGIAAVASQFVNVVLGNQWEPMIPLVQILAIGGGIRAFAANSGAVFKAVGRPDYDVRLQAVKTVTIAVSIYPAAEYFGIVGVAYVILGSALIMQPILVQVVLEIIEADLYELLSIVIYPLLGSIVMAAIVTVTDKFVLSQGILGFIMLIIIGIVSYIGFMLVIEAQTEYEFLDLYRTLRESV